MAARGGLAVPSAITRPSTSRPGGGGAITGPYCRLGVRSWAGLFVAISLALATLVSSAQIIVPRTVTNGLVTETDHAYWSPEHLEPYVSGANRTRTFRAAPA